MKPKAWIITGLVFLMSSSLWGGYLLSRRAFLRDFNNGVHSYLEGNFIDAENQLLQAHVRRPRNTQVQQLLLKVLIEQSFAQYHRKDYPGALETLARAAQIMPPQDPSQQTLAALREQLSHSTQDRPVHIEQVLDGLYRKLPEQDQPSSLESMMEQWLQRSQMSQEAILKHFWSNQERWLVELQHEKSDFKKILYGGLVLFGVGGIVLLVLLLGMLHTYFGRRGIFSRLLEDHYQRLIAALPAGAHVLLGPPISLLHGSESQAMDAIEAEIISGSSTEEPRRRLESLLEEGDPWIRARAAKILYRLNPTLALEELKALIRETPKETQIAGMWALAEVATPEAVDLLATLATSPLPEIQQGTIRSLLQLQAKDALPADTRTKLQQALSDIRSRTGWIF